MVARRQYTSQSVTRPCSRRSVERVHWLLRVFSHQLSDIVHLKTVLTFKININSGFAGIAYFAVGYAFALGDQSNAFIGYSGFFLIGNPTSRWHLWFYHFVYAATASTIVSGAVAERIEFIAYLIYCVAITGDSNVLGECVSALTVLTACPF